MCFPPASRGLGLAALALVGAVIAAPRFANASAANITFAAPTITVTTGGGPTANDQTGYFDVTVTDSAAGDGMAQFGVSIVLNQGSSDVSIVGADLGQLTNPYTSNADGIGDAAGSSPNLIDPYVLAGNSSEVSSNQAVPYGGDPDEDYTDASNSDLTNSGTNAMTQNTVYSLFQVYYDIPAGTPIGTYAITIDTTSYATDPNGAWVNLVSPSTTTFSSPGSFVQGAIVVQGPEPASVVLMLFGAIGLIGFGIRRARRA